MQVFTSQADQTARPVTPFDLIQPEVAYRSDLGLFYFAANVNGALSWVPVSGPTNVPPVAVPALEPPLTTAMSLLPFVGAAVTIADTAYFVYLGLTGRQIVANFIEFHVTAGGTGAQTAEVGIFSSPSAPNRAGQSLTKLAANGTLSALTGTGVMRNTADLATPVAPGVHLWAGLRTNLASTQPAVFGITADMSEGLILALTTAGALTAAGPFAGALIAPVVTAWQAPNLRLICT